MWPIESSSARGRRRFPAELVDGRRRDAKTSDVLTDPIAENGRSVGDISEVEPPKDGAVLREKPRFERWESCTYLARAIREPPRLVYIP
jgi:hypothetical protein